MQTSAVLHHPSQGVSGQINGRILKFGRADFAWPDAIEHPYSDTGQWLLLADEQQPLAWFLLNDSVRRSAEPVIKALKARGIQVSLLTGDPSPAALTIAASLGIDDVRSGVSPAEKLEAVKHWQQHGERVMMVGDGINDVPVLAGADVSLAVNEASDLAKTNADMLLTNGRLEALISSIDVAQRTHHIIRQNIGWALLYNLIALPLAAAGLIPPWAAAIGMSFSSLLVVFNALRLIRNRPLSLNEV
jgi:Cu2+-exporting ATPase